MKHLTILIPGAQTGPNTVSCIVGTWHIFTGANEYWKKKGKPALFNITLAGVPEQAAFVNGLLSISPQVNISSIDKTDLAIIPAIKSDFKKTEKENLPLVDWLREQYKKGTELASMCTGAYLLASTGILDGKSCSIHWNAADNFRNLFPKVIMKADQLITDEYGVYTNGGGYSFLNLLIYLVEKYYDRQTAIYCSKIFQIDMDRNLQSEFSIFNGHKKHNDGMVLEAQQYLEENYTDKISIERLSAKYNISRRSFDRRFIRSTALTPLEYLQRVKVEAAKKAFEKTRQTVSEVMYEVGYNDTKAFREVFSRVTGMSPINYKSRYGK